MILENERFPPGYAPPAKVVTYETLSDLEDRFDDALLAQGLDYDLISSPPN